MFLVLVATDLALSFSHTVTRPLEALSRAVQKLGQGNFETRRSIQFKDEFGDMGVKKGDWVKIMGCRAEINPKEVFMAAKVKKGNYFEFKVRLTQNGKPSWTTTPEKLVRQGPAANW